MHARGADVSRIINADFIDEAEKAKPGNSFCIDSAYKSAFANKSFTSLLEGLIAKKSETRTVLNVPKRHEIAF